MAAVAVLALAACAPAGAGRHASADVTRSALAASLLQSDDLPGLSGRRVFASNALSVRSTPQLLLCEADHPDAPHEQANVIAELTGPRGVRVFEILSAYADVTAAAGAFDRAVARVRACASGAQGFRVTDVSLVPISGSRAVHYAVSTADVVSGDVRTLAQRGRYLILLTGYGLPPGGASLREYQRVLMIRALRHVA